MIERVYHRFDTLEEYRDGMWRIVRGLKRVRYRTAAAKLMKNPEAFKEAMLRALEMWPSSCEHNLTAENNNRIAWLGHAGCCVETESPEDCTRQAWHTLNQTEQDAANAVAVEVLKLWAPGNQSPDLFIDRTSC